ncbi:FUSC family membrane protein [Algibacter miyuki]|uniref:FUSC family membrane protein n=1 Tax=Algibacter miyuki TaxID=1306933 RepID=A0ABV5H264_9FLAO|nr:FUSC family membrane protein [Algibacter miyuki]MDN3666601.1 FUSC family membrane protein [Algibacter miyuki]
MKTHLKNAELFLKGSNFYRGVRVASAVVTPFIILFFFGYEALAPSVMVGVFLNAPGDIPGSLKRKVNGILISIGLTMLITGVILFLKPYLILLLVAIGVISFVVSLLSVYGFRASLVSFSGLLSMVLALAIHKETAQDIFLHIGLMGIGGLWYLLVSFTFQKLSPRKDNNQLLADTLQLIGQYLKLRARLLTKKKKRETLIQEALVLQTQINEKHETLREALFTERKRSGRSHYDEKQLLIFISTINIFEVIEAKHLDYNEIDRLFKDKKEHLRASKNLNKVLGNHLIVLSERLIQSRKIPSKDSLLEALSGANQAITDYVEDVKLPKARKGALVLKNLYDYQELLLQEIRSIRRVMANVNEASKVSLKRQDRSQFLTLQEYHFSVVLQNLSFNSNLFRHALRFTVAMVFAFVLGTVLEIHNTYWILLTIIVIIRPNYGLTKTRSKDRVVGTLIGAIVAISIVLITQNIIIYGVLAIVSLIFAFALIQQNYKSGAALITINVIFVYSLINPNAFEVIQYRVIDTVIGATIAILANYILWPSWEVNNLKEVLLDALKKNKNYLLATQDLYHDKKQNLMAYKVARKELFLAISNLNAGFQRLTQDPKSKQKEFRLIYSLVTLNQTIVSATASIGSFIINHKTTPASHEFDAMILKIANTLQMSCAILEGIPPNNQKDKKEIEVVEDVLLKTFKDLSDERDNNIKKGNIEINTETMHQLQEAYLIPNQLIWLKSLSENLKKATISYSEIL